MGDGATFATQWDIPDVSVFGNNANSVNMVLGDRAADTP